MVRPVRIFLVGSEFFGTPGGIQRVNCLLLEMLGEFAAQTSTKVEVFSFADATKKMPGEFAALPGFQWRAFKHSRTAMATHLARRLREVRPDLLLFTHAHLLRLVRLARMLRPGAKVAVLGHGVEVWTPLPEPIRRSIQRADAVVAPSVFTRDRIVEVSGVNPARISVLAHGLDAKWRAGMQARGHHAGTRLLSVSRLSAEDAYKGIDVVLRSLPFVLKQHPETSLVVLGDGTDRPRFVRLTHDLGIERHVQFCGEVNDDRLHSLYAEADVFVLPSQKEGFGIVFLEAMSYGLPVVAARAGGTLGVVQDGVTGLLVPPEQPEALAEALNRLLGDGPRLRALGEAGKRRVEENFLFEHFSQRWQRWLVALLPEAIYRARQVAAFARVSSEVSRLMETAA
jgi:glycosyltransferase involved in cell wall biosynthesis